MDKSESTLQVKRKTMKKLKLFGVKDPKLEEEDSKLVATVYVDANKKIIVEAEDPKVKEDLLKAIYYAGKDRIPVILVSGPAPTEKLRKEEKEKGIKRIWTTGMRPGDPEYLDALLSRVCKKFGDYYIYWPDIVEE